MAEGKTGSKGKKGKKGKKSKKVSPEELAAQAIQQEIQPVFDLFDADKDGFLSLREFACFMEAVCAPLTEELEERVETAFSVIDVQIATEFVREVRNNMHIADRMKAEFFSVLNLTATRAAPVLEAKVLAALLCTGDAPLLPKEVRWLLKAVKKSQLGDLQRQLIGEGRTPDEIKAALGELQASDITDVREVIKVMNFSIQTGTCLLPDDEKEKRRKEELKRKEAARKAAEKKQRQ